MGPFRRGKRELSATPPRIDLKVEDSAYRRLGEALATVMVTLAEPPPPDAQLAVRTDAAGTTVDPMMVTHEMPGTKTETHRLWFTVDLTAVMFGDGDFALRTADGEAAIPHPVAQPAWGTVEEDDPNVSTGALAEAELRAAVASLEERIREAEQKSADLKADSRRLGETVAATLAEVKQERDRLMELVTHDPGDEKRSADTKDPEDPEQPAPRPDAFLARLQAARGAAAEE